MINAIIGFGSGSNSALNRLPYFQALCWGFLAVIAVLGIWRLIHRKR